MSRNSDKANTLLSRFQEQKAEAAGYKNYSRYKRPTNVSKVASIQEAEGWRKEVLRDISNKITHIHDPSLSEFQIRELNDELNKLFKEKYTWEYHIHKTLGGVDYSHTKISGGRVINGYRYFGRAVELPGVQELLREQKQQQENVENSKRDEEALQKKIVRRLEVLDADYYGYNEDDAFEVSVGDIDLRLRRDIEEHAVDSELLQHERQVSRKQPKLGNNKGFGDIYVPSQAEMEAWIVKVRKQQLSQQL